MKKNILILTLVLAMSLCMLASGTVIAKSKKTDNNKTVLKLSKADMCLYVGQVRKLDYSLSGNKKLRECVKWKSSNKKIATVNKKGEIKGKKTGKTKITAWIKGDVGTKAVCKVKVKEFKEMNYSVPFNEVKYIKVKRFDDVYGDLVNAHGYSKVIESRKEWNEFLKKSKSKKDLDDKGYSFDDIDFSKNNILVYERDIMLVQRINKIDYSLIKNGSDVEMHIDVEYIEEPGVMYPCIINRCLVFEVMPKKFVEGVDKLVHGTQNIWLNDNN